MVFKLTNLFQIFERIGGKFEDSRDTIIRKTTLTSMALIAGSLAGVWSLIFFILNLNEVGIIAFSYFASSYLGIIIFWKTKSEKFLLNSQLVLAIFLPYLATIIMGGFILSAVVIVWSLLTPFGALLFSDYRKSPKWFLLFIILLITGGYFGYIYQPFSTLPPEGIQLFFILNLGGITFVIFFIVYYFVDEKEKALQTLNNIAKDQFSELINNLEIAESDFYKNTSQSNPVLFMIINFNGVSIFSKFFGENQKFDNQLISGFLTAINSIGQNAFGAKILKEIKYKDFYLFFEILQEKRFVYAFAGNYLVGRTKFESMMKSVLKEEYNFIFKNEWKSINNDPKLNDLVNSIFV